MWAIVTLYDTTFATAHFIQLNSHGHNEVLFCQNSLKKHKNFSKNIVNVFSTVACFHFPFNHLCDHLFFHIQCRQPTLTNAISQIYCYRFSSSHLSIMSTTTAVIHSIKIKQYSSFVLQVFRIRSQILNQKTQ